MFIGTIYNKALFNSGDKLWTIQSNRHKLCHLKACPQETCSSAVQTKISCLCLSSYISGLLKLPALLSLYCTAALILIFICKQETLSPHHAKSLYYAATHNVLRIIWPLSSKYTTWYIFDSCLINYQIEMMRNCMTQDSPHSCFALALPHCIRQYRNNHKRLKRNKQHAS